MVQFGSAGDADGGAGGDAEDGAGEAVANEVAAQPDLSDGVHVASGGDAEDGAGEAVANEVAAQPEAASKITAEPSKSLILA